MIHPYIKRKIDARNGIPYKMNDPVLEEIVGRTYGVPIFQEQIMQLAIKKADFTAGEADQLRRSLGQIRSAGDVLSVTARLHERLIANGVTPAYATELLGYVKGYSHYGFPESHAASFAMISYKSAYLKCHYPAQFLCGLINSQPMGFYPVDTLVNCAKRAGVTVLPIHPLISKWDATMEEVLENDKPENGTPESGSTPKKTLAVRMGFRNLRQLNRESYEVMELEREQKPFTDLLDFVQRTRFSREVIELLSLADAFSCFGLDQRHTLWTSIEHQSLFDRAETDQLPLFTDTKKIDLHSVKQTFQEMTLYEQMIAQYHAMGFSIKGNLMHAIRHDHPRLPKATSQTLRETRADQYLTVVGILMVIQRPPTAKGTCFITLEDEFGSMDVILRPKVFEEFRSVISSSRVLQLSGRVQVAGEAHTMMITHVMVPDLSHSIRAKNVYHGMHPRELKMDFVE
jgi:error-prone DNA polymerase